ncbi:MAG: HD domain-containing protein [Halobacteriovoraceae bacterium]|nr:HD domain-containing protein [Halobacteriovoraceae bacterium]MCB9095793.1 HD domain-containing protein [Halobacteriovoraceae bacterium]
MKDVYFSINIDYLPLNDVLGIDLYINSSSKEAKTHFIKIFPANDSLNLEFKEHLKNKYFRVYVNEKQRNNYLKLITRSTFITDVQKTNVVKDTAIHYLDSIFNSNGDKDVIIGSIHDCRETVDNMVDVIHDKNVEEIQSLIAELSFHDFYTFDHSINVCMYSIGILKGIDPNITRDDLINIGVGALLHDIGKIKVPTSVINKPSHLSDEEFEKIKKHPIDGYDILKELKPSLGEGIDWESVLAVVCDHHENYDGSGYPHGKKNKDIHYFPKVCMLADILDAITTKRSYNEVLPIEKALEIMGGMVGKKIDPELFAKFLGYMKIYIPEGKTTHKLNEKFDPSVPFEVVELEEVKKDKEKGDFGKIITKAS